MDHRQEVVCSHWLIGYFLHAAVVTGRLHIKYSILEHRNQPRETRVGRLNYTHQNLEESLKRELLCKLRFQRKAVIA